MLLTLINKLVDLGARGATGVVMANYSSAIANEITPYCTKATDGRYPFSRKSADDMPLDDFTQLFRAGGVIDAFFQKYLADKVDSTGSRWVYKPMNDIPIGSGDLIQFQRAKRIRDVFFGGGASIPSMTLEFLNESMDPLISRFSLDVDGEKVTYANQVVVPQRIKWPADRGARQVRLDISPPAPSGRTGKTFDGPWALFRLFDDSKAEVIRPDRFRWTFDVDGRKATFIVNTNSVQNPFSFPELADFKCPTGR
jgi:type VI secretion system protein ImpL